MDKRILLVCVLGCGSLLRASTVVLDFRPAVVGGTNGQWSLGWSFLVNFPIAVTALDFWDDKGDGLAESHEVGIFDSSAKLLISTTVTPADPLVGLAPWRSHAVLPAVLSRGLYYVAATTGSENYYWDPAGLTTIPQISYLSDQYAEGLSLTFPGGSGGITIGYFGPSFEADPVAVPEASSLMVLGAGLVAIGILGSRRPR